MSVITDVSAVVTPLACVYLTYRLNRVHHQLDGKTTALVDQITLLNRQVTAEGGNPDDSAPSVSDPAQEQANLKAQVRDLGGDPAESKPDPMP